MGRAAVIDLPGDPLSPWLRLAHITTLAGDAPGTGMLRVIDDYMLMLQLEGTSFVWWEPARGSVALPPGSIAFIPPGPVHAWGECPGAHLAVHFDLHADPLLPATGMLHHLGKRVAPRPLPEIPLIELRPTAGGPLRIPLATRLRQPGRWRERFEPLVAMYGAQRHRGPAERLRAAGILSAAVADLAATDAVAAVDPRVQRILAELDKDYARPWRLDGLARRARMGEAAFRAAFLGATGAAPREHLEALRIDRAAELLLETDQAVAAIGARVGFPDAYHFSRVFRRRMGASPRAFRQQRAR